MQKIEKALGRYPDFIIGDEHNPYLLRWWVIPRNRFFNIYLHKFCRSDDDRALHDHPWLFNCSILLRGEYKEHTFKGIFHRKKWAVKFRWGKSPHRVELLKAFDVTYTDPNKYRPTDLVPVWTLFITGPKVREWGFYCSHGWRHWKKFVSLTPGGNSTGRGCD